VTAFPPAASPAVRPRGKVADVPPEGKQCQKGRGEDWLFRRLWRGRVNREARSGEVLSKEGGSVQ